MLTDAKTLLVNAQTRGYAVGAFNIHCLEMIRATIEAADSVAGPVIIQATGSMCRYAGYDLVAKVVRHLAVNSAAPVALHLDHGQNFTEVKQAIEAGFTSVMIDGSALPLSENIALTKEVVDYAHRFNVSVEGELGVIGGTEDGVPGNSGEIYYTDPDDASTFVQQTGVDSLAIAIGTAHGQYKSKAKLDFDVLRAVKQLVPVPLVLHGGTGILDADIARCINNGICKINVGTEQKIAWQRALGPAMDLKNNLRDVLSGANLAVRNVVEGKMRLFGSAAKI